MTIQVQKREGESSEKLLKRFSGHVKSTKLINKIRKLRYFKQKPRKTVVRGSAVMREMHRENNKRKQYLS